MCFVVDVVWCFGGGVGDDGFVGFGDCVVDFFVLYVFDGFEYCCGCMVYGDEIGVFVVDFV